MIKKINKFKKKLKIYFFWLTFERYPNLFRPSSKPYISGDTFRGFANHIFDESKTLNTENIEERDIVFVSGNLIDTFFKYFHPKINEKYILLTHNSDRNINEIEASYLDEKVIHWYAQNLGVVNKKISLLPIGLENLRRLKYGRKKWFSGDLVDTKSKNILFSFDLTTNYQERQKAYEALNIDLEYQIFSTPSKYFNELSKSKFVITPEGNGYDTHRIWESLIFKTFPVMQESKFTENLKELGVPGIFLHNWSDLLQFDEVTLSKKYNELLTVPIKHLTSFKFWSSKISTIN